MKKILHSGEFLDYDGNTIRVSFYKEYHLWVSTSVISAPYTGGEYDLEVWSDAGYVDIRDFDADWFSVRSLGDYKNDEGLTVSKYRIIITGRPPEVLAGTKLTAELTFFLEAQYDGIDLKDYDGYLSRTISVIRRQ